MRILRINSSKLIGQFRPLLFILLVCLIFTGALTFTRSAESASCFFYSDEIGYVCDGRLQPEPDQFEVPADREDSLLDWVRYAYMEDNINIYPEPNLATPPVRNVGEGFLYITIQRKLEANGQSWYQINPNEYALAEGIRLVETPTFRGTEINFQPERPFGWIVRDVRPSSEPSGEPNEELAKLERFSFIQVYDFALGEGDWIWYEIGGGRWIRQTYVSIVDVNSRPPEVGADEYWVEVDLYEQTFAAYEGSRMVYAGLVSSGLNRWPTEEGIFQVFARYTQAKMSGAEGEVDYYFIEDVPHIMYFDRPNEIALHGAYWHDRYGYKHSHGCVNMPPRDAEWVFYWSAEASNDLWVWVHTSDPMSVFDGSLTEASISQANAY